MNRKLPLIGDFATDWIRYSDYEYKENNDGDLYIVPAEGATFSMYNPFDVAENLLLDLMHIGDEALKEKRKSNKRNIEELKNQILIFAKKYGLLGFVSASVYNRNIIGEEKVLLIDNNHVTKEKVIDGDQYIARFIPFTEEGDIVYRAYKHNVDVVKREDSPKFYGHRPVVLDLVFSKFYAEQVDWIIGFAKMISTHFNQILTYRNASQYLHENITIMSGQFHAEKIGFTIKQLDKTTIAWQFDSLKTAIETIYGFAVTDETTILTRCTHCNNIFIANSNREKYCDPACRNRANVQKSRRRKSEQMEE